MTRFAVGCLSVLVFMTGTVVLLALDAVTWMYLVALCARETNWVIAAGLFIAGLWAARNTQPSLTTSWTLWHRLWLWADDKLERRMSL